MSGIAIDITIPLEGLDVVARFDAPSPRIVSLFGPSGAGKTTLLRAIAGLEPRARGTIRLGDQIWLDTAAGINIPTHRRGVGYVFQEASLFPHLDVRANLNYAFQRAPKDARHIAFDEAVECLGIGALLGRSPSGLSGGERQRVAIARALLTSPRLLLMDEPLASLDEASRAAVLPYIEQLHAALSIPILYVSHALREVARLSHTIVELRDGAVCAAGPAAEMLQRMATTVGDGEAPVSILDVTILRHDSHYHLSEALSPFGSLWIPADHDESGATRRIQIAARDVSLGLQYDHQSSILNQLSAEVASLTETGPAQVLVHLLPSGHPQGVSLLALITRRSRDTLGLKPGTKVFVRVKGVQLME